MLTAIFAKNSDKCVIYILTKFLQFMRIVILVSQFESIVS